jgi:hypothetical protein
LHSSEYSIGNPQIDFSLRRKHHGQPGYAPLELALNSKHEPSGNTTMTDIGRLRTIVDSYFDSPIVGAAA